MKVLIFFPMLLVLFACKRNAGIDTHAMQEEMMLEIKKGKLNDDAFVVRFWLKKTDSRKQYMQMIDSALAENIYLVKNGINNPPFAAERIESGLPDCITYLVFFNSTVSRRDTLVTGEGLPIPGGQVYIIGD